MGEERDLKKRTGEKGKGPAIDSIFPSSSCHSHPRYPLFGLFSSLLMQLF